MQFAFLNRMGSIEAMVKSGRPGRTAMAQVRGNSLHLSGDTSNREKTSNTCLQLDPGRQRVGNERTLHF